MAAGGEAEVQGSVKLFSADGHEFVVDRKAAMVCLCSCPDPGAF